MTPIQFNQADQEIDKRPDFSSIIIPQFQSSQPQKPFSQQNLFPEQKRKTDKNKFINKLRHLQDSGHSQMKTFYHTYNSQSGASLGPRNRKESNKIAARSSRDRKKLYVKLMENKLESIQREIQDTVNDIEQVRKDIFSAQMHEGQQGKEAQHKQIHIIKKLEGLLADLSLEERNNQINICVDSIIYRIGALGKERKAALSKLYFHLLNFSQPALYRYILWSAVQRKHLFGQTQISQDEKWCREIEPVANEVVASATANGVNLMEKREQLASHCHHFTKSAEDLAKFRSEIEKKGQGLDNIFNEIRQVLSPEQVANLILFVQKYQFKKEIHIFEHESKEEQLEQLSKQINFDW